MKRARSLWEPGAFSFGLAPKSHTMFRFLLSSFLLAAGTLIAQEAFPTDQYQTAKRDPVRDISHMPQMAYYEIPDNEISDVGSDWFRWDSTGRWLRQDLMAMRKMTVFYENPDDGAWYVVGKGMVRGFGARIPTKWNGRYVVEIRDQNYPLVFRVQRQGDQHEAEAIVVGDPGH